MTSVAENHSSVLPRLLKSIENILVPMLWTDILLLSAMKRARQITILSDVSARSSYCKGFSARGFCLCISFVNVIKVQVLLQAAPATVVHVQLEMVFPSDLSDVLARLLSPG